MNTQSEIEWNKEQYKKGLRYILHYDKDTKRSYYNRIHKDGSETFDHWEPPTFSAMIERVFPGKEYRL